MKLQTVRIFRKKEDNFEAMILLEFFDFIGFLTTDFVIEDREKFSDLLVYEYYDINIILKMEDNSHPLLKYSYNGIRIIGNTASEVLDEILKKEEFCLNSEPMDTIINFFKEKRLPAVIYNMKNTIYPKRHFINKENYKKNKETGKTAYKQSLDILLECYKKLEEFQRSEKFQTATPYAKYAVLNIKCILNETAIRYPKMRIFDGNRLEKYAEEIVQEYPSLFLLVY